MLDKKDNKRISLIIRLLISAIVSFVLIGYFLSSYLFQSKLSQQIELSNLNIEYDDISLNILTGNISVSNLKYTDTTSFPINGTIYSSFLELKGVNLFRALLKHEYFASQIVVSDPMFELLQLANRIEKIDSTQKDSMVVFPFVEIGSIVVKNGYLKVKDTLHTRIHVSDLDVRVSNIQLDSMSDALAIQTLFEELSLECRVETVVDTLGLFNVENFNLTKNTLSFSGMSFVPLLSKDEFLQVKRRKNNWVEVSIGNIDIDRFNWSVKKGEKPSFRGRTVQLDSLQVNVLADKWYAKANQGVKPMLSEFLRSLPVVFNFDSIRVKEATIQVGTRSQNTNSIGVLLLDETYASGYNLHNDSLNMKSFELDFVSRFMKKATVEASYKMDVNDPVNRFRCSGNMSNLTTRSLNKILSPMAGVETAGQLYGLQFNILADHNKSVGTVDFEYENLKIEVLNQSTKNKDVVLSIISNLALKKKNIKTDRHFKQGVIDYRRDKNKSVFGYIFDSMKDGLVDTLIPFDLERKRKLKFKFNRNRE